MSYSQTKELHDWQREDAQATVSMRLALLRGAQEHLYNHRRHGMPRLLIASGERMVKLRLDHLWAAQEGVEQLKPVETCTP